jgi:trehalose/maltose hydrolase-like predicted phosphorylase
VVVADLAGLDLLSPTVDATTWCGGADLTGGPWLLTYHGFDLATEGIRETLCTLGNGYWASRGAAPEATADGVHYPGTYFAGVYNRLTSAIDGAKVEDESMVNAPNWLPLTLRHPGGEPIGPGGDGIRSYRQELDLQHGVLIRALVHRDPAGRSTRITSRKLVSRAQPHLAALETTIEALDWSGPLHAESAVDGQVTNTGVAEYQAMANRHLEPVAATTIDTETVLLKTVTSQSRINIAIAARTRVHCGGDQLNLPRRPTGDGKSHVGQAFTVDLAARIPVRIEKVVAAATSRDRAISTSVTAALRHLSQAGDFTGLLTAHERAWRQLWDEFAITVAAGDQAGLALNLHTFHVLQTTPASDVDAGLPARGLAGEGYRGHVFWDELFIYPMLTLRRPELTRRLLGYRYRRLPAAKAAAQNQGLAGVLFPWP